MILALPVWDQSGHQNILLSGNAFQVTIAPTYSLPYSNVIIVLVQDGNIGQLT